MQDLASVFIAVLYGSMNREIYFALGKPWILDERIAREAIRIAGSSSEIELRPNADTSEPKLFTLEKIKEHFGFTFDSWPYIVDHLTYLIGEVV